MQEAKSIAAEAGPAAPKALRVCVGIQLVLTLMGVSQILKTPGNASLWLVGSWIVQVAVLVALWNMKRWAALAYVALYTVAVFQAANHAGTTWRAPLAIALLRGIALVPVPFYWRRMSWR